MFVTLLVGVPFAWYVLPHRLLEDTRCRGRRRVWVWELCCQYPLILFGYFVVRLPQEGFDALPLGSGETLTVLGIFASVVAYGLLGVLDRRSDADRESDGAAA